MIDSSCNLDRDLLEVVPSRPALVYGIIRYSDYSSENTFKLFCSNFKYFLKKPNWLFRIGNILITGGLKHRIDTAAERGS